MTSAERTLHLLQTLLDRRDRDRAPTRTARVLGRHADGTERIQRTDAACVTRATRDNHYAGTVIVEPKLAAFHRTGSAGIAAVTEVLSAETLWIERLDPNVYEPGQTYQVTVHGRGFDDRVRIDFLLPDPFGGATLHPDLAVLAVLFVSPELLELELAVAPTTHALSNAPIAYGKV